MAVKDFVIENLRGGLNNSDPPSAVPEDQVVEAENVEFNRSTLGERRRGAATVTITGSGLEDQTHLTFLHRFLPTADETAAELWALAVTPDVSSRLARKTTTWNTVNPVDAIGIAGTQGFNVYAQSLHGKLFLAYKSAVDRLHVWDGTSLRRVGIAEPAAAPTGADDGGVGTFVGTRYYRVRFTIQAAGVTKLRSEPSDVLTFVPNGNDTGVTVTRPAAGSEGATHWELEASIDNVLFYRIATTAIGTTSVTDTQDFVAGYAITFPLSEDIGDYTVPWSPKFLSADEDRLMMAGSWEQPGLGSRVAWTPVLGDPGSGNDERIPIDTDNYIDLDGYEGGEITALSDVTNGYVYAFKLAHIYKMVRTGQRLRAYDAFCLSKQRGALPGSLVAGVDQIGNPALYFLDQQIGPCRVGNLGLQGCSADIQETWRRVNVNASTVICRGVYYPDSQQVIWWVAVDGGNTPTLKLVLQVNESRHMDDGVRRGWSTGTGLSATAISACLFASNINDNAARNMTLRPFIGLGGSVASILRLDTGTTDAGTVYYSHVTTKPYTMAGILNRFGIMAGAVLAKAADSVTLFVKAVRDFGVEGLHKSVSLTPEGNEEHVIRPIDNLAFSELHTLHIIFGDDPEESVVPEGDWECNQIAIKMRTEERA